MVAKLSFAERGKVDRFSNPVSALEWRAPADLSNHCCL